MKKLIIVFLLISAGYLQSQNFYNTGVNFPARTASRNVWDTLKIDGLIISKDLLVEISSGNGMISFAYGKVVRDTTLSYDSLMSGMRYQYVNTQTTYIFVKGSGGSITYKARTLYGQGYGVIISPIVPGTITGTANFSQVKFDTLRHSFDSLKYRIDSLRVSLDTLVKVLETVPNTIDSKGSIAGGSQFPASTLHHVKQIMVTNLVGGETIEDGSGHVIFKFPALTIATWTIRLSVPTVLYVGAGGGSDHVYITYIGD